MSSHSQVGTTSGITTSGIRYRAPSSAPLSEPVKAFLSLIIVVSVCFGLFSLAPKKVKFQLTEKARAIYLYANKKYFHLTPENIVVETPLDGKIPEGGVNFASKLTMNILVKSNPGRAKIFVNGTDQGFTTPATIEVPANKPFSLTLLADGYHQYTTRVTATKNGQEVSAELSQIKFGYININVINSGIDTIISVNGVELQDRPPISKYPVPSGQPITIRALHPFSGTSAETVITVGADEKKTVDLILTIPSSPKEDGKK